MLLSFIDYLLTPFTRNFISQLEKNDNVKELISLYQNNKFLKIRFWDAPYLEVESFIPQKGFIIDLGCGDGFFANYLAIASKNRNVYGIELNKARIKEADKGLKNTKFLNGDITKKEMPNADVIILFHVLHHLNSYNQQKKLLKECSGKIKKGGKLLIVEVEPKISYKYLLAWLVDHFLVPWIFEKRFYSPIYFRSSKEWIDIVDSMGFKSRVFNLEQGKPFPHILIEVIKY